MTVKLLRDDPAEVDAFGSLERLIAALDGLITSEAGGVAIGIQGPWGSGKSTLLRMLARSLSTKAHILLFEFDAWAHQGDPLRRVFLERLASQLSKSSWIAEDSKKKLFNRLSGGVSKSTQTTKPTFTWFGLWFLASLLGVPIGAALVDAGSQKENGALGLVGIGLMLLPVLITLIEMYRNRGKIESLPLLVSSVETESQTTSYESRDPTSVEFEDEFSKLITEALGNEDRKLVISLDNLDRVDSEDFRSVWSALQPYIHPVRMAVLPSRQKLWFVIPYDLKGLMEHGNHEFIEKAFDIVFAVPPLITSGWKTYLLDRLVEAFPKSTAEERYEVYKVFNVVVGGRPRPRQLKAFVNQIGSVYRQWPNECPLHYQAYFALVRGGDGFLNSIRAKGEDLVSVFGSKTEDAVDWLAAMHFNVERAQARQLLLHEPVLKALEGGDGTGLKTQAQEVGFWEVLEEMDSESEPANKLLRCARAIEFAGLRAEGRPELNRYLTRLERRILNVVVWAPANEIDGLGLAAVYTLFDGRLTTTVHAALSKVALANENFGSWCISVLDYLKVATDLEPSVSKIAIPARAEHWIAFCEQWTKTDLECRLDPFLKSPHDAELIAGQYLAVIVGGQTTGHIADGLLRSANLFENWPWASVLTAAEPRIRRKATVEDVGEVLSVLELVRRIGQHYEPALATIEAVRNEGWLHSHLHWSVEARNWLDVGRLCLEILDSPSGLQQPQAVASSIAGWNWLRAFAQSPNTYPDVAKVVSDSYATRLDKALALGSGAEALVPLVTEIVRQAIPEIALPAQLSSEDLLLHWKLIEASMSSEDQKVAVIRGFLPKGLLAAVQAGPLDANYLALYGVLSKLSDAPEFAGWLVLQLKARTREQWITSLQFGDIYYQGLELAVSMGVSGLEFPLVDALIEFAKGSSSTPTTLTSNAYHVAASVLSEQAKEVYEDKLIGLVLREDGQTTAQTFELFGSVIAAAIRTAEKNHVTELFEPIVSRRNAPGLRWMTDVINSKQHLLRDYPLAHMKSLTEKLSEWRSADPPPGVIADLETMLELIGGKNY